MRCAALLLLSLGTVALAQTVSVNLQDGRFALTCIRDGASIPVLQGVGYCARVGGDVSFETGAATLSDDDMVSFALSGPDAGNARVSARYTRLAHGFALDWKIRYAGPKRAWNPWTSGFRYDFAQAITGARERVVTRWVSPTGAHAYEVPGDTPYPDTECQLRQVLFGDLALVMVSSTYDPDWIYQGNVQRARFSRMAPPVSEDGAPVEFGTRTAFLALPASQLDPQRLAAESAGRPVDLALTTGRVGNLFTPGEPLRFEAVVCNVIDRDVPCTLDLQAWSYQGKQLLNRRLALTVEAGGTRALPQTLTCLERSVVFLVGRLSWEGGEQLQRGTIGVLPERPHRAGQLLPESPFAMAAVIANPKVYPDQYELPVVLEAMERIGVTRIRGPWYPLKAQWRPEDEAEVWTTVEQLKQHGILPYAQLGSRLPEPDDLAEYTRPLASTLERFQGASREVEVGNELNFSTSGADYVEKMLRPTHDIMRASAPHCRILSMGLGGVTRKWLGEFAQAGGMELIDVLSIHPGCHPRAPEFWEGWFGWVFRPQVQDALKAAREHGNKEVWITEAYAPTPPGRSGVDLRTSADYMVRTYICSIALGVKVIAWYQFQDGVWHSQRPRPDDVEYNFGIVYTDLTPKPAYVAFGAMTEQLEGARCEGRLALGADDLYAVRFQRADGPLDVLWSYREKHETDLAWWPPERFKDCSRKPMEPWKERWEAPVEVVLPAAGPVTVTDIMGNARTVATEGGRVRMWLTGSPVYVRGLGNLPRLPKFWEDIP